MSSPAWEQSAPSPMIGPARLIRAAFEGADMAARAGAILARSEKSVLEAGTALDLATILLLMHRFDEALQLQRDVLRSDRHFELLSNRPETTTRILVIVTAGDLMANTPIDFLLDEASFRVEYLFVLPGEAVPYPLPAHDVCIVGVAYATAHEPLLEALASAASHWDRPVINQPRAVLKTSRHGLAEALAGANGIVIPTIARATKSDLISSNFELPAGLSYPVLIRPFDTHAGNALQKVDGPESLRDYCARTEAVAFYISQFCDYSGTDGLFRKLRIVLIDGAPYLCHLALRDHWMIHYLNAGMADDPAKREVEARAMAAFDDLFVPRHRDAFAEIHRRMGLDYLILDCAEDRNGCLLIFEADTGMVIHDMDPVDLFPYKRPHMQGIFAAFHRAIIVRANRGAQLAR